MKRECPYCGAKVVKRDSSVIYGKSYGWAWICSRFPECDAYVGCHSGTTTPLGRLANSELRRWKRMAHDAFDPIWKRRTMRRGAAYVWLAERLGIDVADCHIGMMDVEQCKAVIRACRHLQA